MISSTIRLEEKATSKLEAIISVEKHSNTIRRSIPRVKPGTSNPENNATTAVTVTACPAKASVTPSSTAIGVSKLAGRYSAVNNPNTPIASENTAIQAGPSFGLGFAAKPGHAYFHFLAVGTAVLRAEDGTLYELSAGNAVFIAQGEAHQLLSSLDVPAQDIGRFDAPPLGEAVCAVDASPGAEVSPSTIIFSGCMEFELGSMQGLGGLMPDLMLIDARGQRYPWAYADSRLHGARSSLRTRRLRRHPRSSRRRSGGGGGGGDDRARLG
jgi:hypothetical protein